jgi:hypothetical protein
MGLGDGPAALQDSALIMIDCQNTYRRGVMQLDGAEDAFAEAARMLARARAAGIPVFHIMHDAGQGSPYDVTAEIGQISDEVAPIAGEPVIVKNYPSSFFQTDLGAQLEKTGRHARRPPRLTGPWTGPGRREGRLTYSACPQPGIRITAADVIAACTINACVPGPVLG